MARSGHEEWSLLASKNLGSAETSPLPVQGVSMAIEEQRRVLAESESES